MAGQQPYIAHFDLDAFFVSVERILDPSLVGKALILGGSRERGVVSTCSYEARKFGVHSAMPMARAVALCPHAIVMQGTRGQYSKFSQWVTDIIAAKSPLYEKASIDEFYIDLTGMDRFFDPLQWTIDLRKEIIETTGLPISFGLASNKMVAKMATNAAKPNGFLQVLPGKEKEFLSPLQVGEIPGVGEHMLKTMHSLGIMTISDLSVYPQHLLEQNFGKYGEVLLQKANGKFTKKVLPLKNSDVNKEEDMGLLLFDADGDGDNDLYVTRGSYQHDPGSNLYQDILCENDGKGNFTIVNNA